MFCGGDSLIFDIDSQTYTIPIKDIHYKSIKVSKPSRLMSNIKFLKWIRENFPLRWIGGWGDPNCSTIILNIPVFDNYAIEGFPDAKCCPLCGSNLKGDDKNACEDS